MTDTTVAALIVSDLSDTEGLQAELHAAYRALMVVVSERNSNLDAIEAAQRRIMELEAIEVAARRLAVRQSGDYQAYMDEQREALADLRAALAAPHDAEGGE